MKQRVEEANVTRTVWQPMRLRWVGDVGLVMTRKSGRHHDGFFHRRKKRNRGYSWDR